MFSSYSTPPSSNWKLVLNIQHRYSPKVSSYPFRIIVHILRSSHPSNMLCFSYFIPPSVFFYITLSCFLCWFLFVFLFLIILHFLVLFLLSTYLNLVFFYLNSSTSVSITLKCSPSFYILHVLFLWCFAACWQIRPILCRVFLSAVAACFPSIDNGLWVYHGYSNNGQWAKCGP
jgi:hypothetical protein